MKKSILKKVLTVIVTMAMFTMFSQPMVEAATTKFISEVVLAYGETDDEAKQKLKDAGYSVLPKNLNEGMDNFTSAPKVYMGYKTSQNVDDAITDIAVMDMNGGYSAENYEQLLTESRNEYRAMVEDYRIAANEFRQNYYARNDVMAQAAYRQMNYYKDDDTGKLMGDFFLNYPGDEQLVTILMQGNVYILANLRYLLAMGVAGIGKGTSLKGTFLKRAEEFAKNPDTCNKPEYYDDAVTVSESLENLSGRFSKYLSVESELSFDSEAGEDEMEYAETAGLYELLKGVTYGSTNLADFITAGNWTIEDLYPLVAAMSDGQRALTRLGQFSAVCMYNTTDKTAMEYNSDLSEIEKNITVTSVYMGVDRSIFKDTLAVTTEALRASADTGDHWYTIFTNCSWGSYAAYGAAGLLMATSIFMAVHTVTWTGFKELCSKTVQEGLKNGTDFEFDGWVIEDLESAKDTQSICRGTLGIALGLALLASAIISITVIVNYYYPDYLDIPVSLVDVFETTNGDHYVKYDAVKNVEQNERILQDGTKIQEYVPADLNGFYAKQWNALYVTKDYSAGKPLMATKINYRLDNSKLDKGYAPVHYFGEEVTFNLNSHAYSDDAPAIYLSFKQSNAKKTAATVPNVVATNISYGVTVMAGGVGLVAGMGIMGLISRRKPKETNVKGEK